MRITCPLCRQDLDQQPATWRCALGHAYDVAREGYVNLLPVQHKKTRDPGDNPEMVQARRKFLFAGHYQPLRDAVLALLAPLRAHSLLDLGCGEGYYTGAFTAVAPDVAGLDISKPAIQLAAKQFRGITWLVGSGAQLPLADASVDIVSSMFSQLYLEHTRRVLKPGGHLLVVTPAPDHLWSVREKLFDEVRAHQPDKFLAGLDTHFELTARQEVRVPLQLTRDTLEQLLLMTPYAWKARPEKRAALLQDAERFATTAAFTLLLLKQLPSTPAQ